MSVIKNQGMTSALHSFRTDTVLLHTIYQESKTGKGEKKDEERKDNHFSIKENICRCRFITQPLC